MTRAAADHRHPAIRARACAALRELRSLAPQDVDAAIVALGNDAHELVRIAAGTEPMVVTPPWQRPWANALQYWREVRGLR